MYFVLADKKFTTPKANQSTSVVTETRLEVLQEKNILRLDKQQEQLSFDQKWRTVTKRRMT